MSNEMSEERMKEIAFLYTKYVAKKALQSMRGEEAAIRIKDIAKEIGIETGEAVHFVNTIQSMLWDDLRDGVLARVPDFKK